MTCLLTGFVQPILIFRQYLIAIIAMIIPELCVSSKALESSIMSTNPWFFNPVSRPVGSNYFDGSLSGIKII
jgi:hypothetical protein